MRVLRLLTVAIGIIVAGPAFGQTAQDIARLGLSSTVTLVGFDAYGRALSSGSGFVVGPALVLTNDHVVEGSFAVAAYPLGADEGIWVESVVHRDPWLDLALLDMARDVGPPLHLRREEGPEIGETVYAVGSPLGLEGTFTQGIVSSYREIGGMRLMQITAPVSPGNSGGPLLDTSGRVVGVVVASYKDAQNLNFAIPAAEVLGFLVRVAAAIAGEAQVPSAPRNAGLTPTSRAEPADAGASDAAYGAPPAPSFDCVLASTWSERAICGSHVLAELDVLMSEAYARARERLPEAEFDEVRLEQRDWLARRESCQAEAPGRQEACLVALIGQRIAELEAYR